MSAFRNSHGQWFQSGIGGTYPINNGDPQNDVEDFDEDAANRAEDEARERAAEKE